MGLVLMLIWAFGGWSKPINPATERYLATFLATSGNAGDHEQFIRHLNYLQGKHHKFRSESAFVRHIFTSTHRKFLKHFNAQATFGLLFKDGSYNCLTGTILYSLILSDFNIRHQVIETNYHIFILVNTEVGELLLEATDPINGLVIGADEISKRMRAYKATAPTLTTAADDYMHYDFSFDLFDTVTIEELAGLLYYNLAIEAYNKQNLAQAVFYLNESISRYSSPRIEEMARLLLITVHESNLNASEKSRFKKALQAIRYKALPVVASLEP
ncbi:MAG: hypothetical protein HRU69_03650 [Flammeovirgaceae bacterium]|nr:MAG: hypothetical protein HRU69_03650 [Flammeovirgaceae bacterium]